MTIPLFDMVSPELAKAAFNELRLCSETVTVIAPSTVPILSIATVVPPTSIETLEACS